MQNHYWNCSHERLSNNYYESFSCETPFCEGSEIRCLQCGVYITTCGCGYNNGISGWPRKRWNKFIMNKRRLRDLASRHPNLLQNIHRHISLIRRQTNRATDI